MRRSFVVLLATAACSGGDCHKVGTVAAELQPKNQFARLRCRGGAGAITVREDGGPTVRVAGEVLATAGLAERLALGKELTAALPFDSWVRLGEDGDTVFVEDLRSDDEHQLRLTIMVPVASRAFDLQLGVGDVDVQAATVAAIAAEMTAGRLGGRIGTAEGPVRARVTTGQIDLDVGKAALGGVDLEVTAGEVRLGLPGDVCGTFDLHVELGSLAGLDRFGLAEQRSLASVSATGRRGAAPGPTFKVRTTTGQIALH